VAAVLSSWITTISNRRKLIDFQFGFSFEDNIPLLHSIHRVSMSVCKKARTQRITKGRGSFAKRHFLVHLIVN